MDNKKVSVFTHVFKTAGTTLNRILEWQYLFGRGSSYHASSLSFYEYFKKLPREKRKNIKLIKGHFPFGVDKYCIQPTNYFTMLREPDNRLISHYKDTRRLYKAVYGSKGAKELTLKAFLKQGILPVADNCQVRFLSGAIDIPYGSINETHLTMALNNLRTKYSIIGITEYFDESILIFAKTLGWTTPYYVKNNVSKKRDDAICIDSEVQNLLSYYNRYDYRLYAAAVEIFKKQATGMGEHFANEVISFRARNASMTKIILLRDMLLRVLWWLNYKNIISACYLLYYFKTLAGKRHDMPNA